MQCWQPWFIFDCSLFRVDQFCVSVYKCYTQFLDPRTFDIIFFWIRHVGNEKADVIDYVGCMCQQQASLNTHVRSRVQDCLFVCCYAGTSRSWLDVVSAIRVWLIDTLLWMSRAWMCVMSVPSYSNIGCELTSHMSGGFISRQDHLRTGILVKSSKLFGIEI